MLVGVSTILNIWPNWPAIRNITDGLVEVGMVEDIKELNTETKLCTLPVRDAGELHHR